MKKLIVLCLFLVNSLACSQVPTAAGAGGRAKAADDIREAVTRHLIGKNTSRAYFLSLDGKDPSHEFLGRFARGEQKLIVKPVSASRTKGQSYSVVDKETGQSGLEISIGRIEWIDDTSARIEVHSYQDAKAAEGVSVQCDLKDGKWVIKRAWIRSKS
jgi:hypothetical protein